MMPEQALQVSDLSLVYRIRQGEVQAVQGVSFQLAKGMSLGLVGESGCGKSSIANCLMGLLPDNAVITGGQIFLDGKDLLRLSNDELREYRWRRIAMVFQAAMNVLDPVYRVGQQIVEAIEAHGMERTESDARRRVAELFRKVGLDPQLTERYPPRVQRRYEAEGRHSHGPGLRPDVIIADEPTTALDVIVQDRILRELRAIQRENNMAVITSATTSQWLRRSPTLWL